MTASVDRANKGSIPAWLRRTHRWLGVAASLFVLLLSVTGVLLNHSVEWKLDRRYVQWDWLLDAYGIRVPEPSAAYSDGNHYATLLGGHLFFDDQEVARDVDGLTGMVIPGDVAIIATTDGLLLVTQRGEFVERIDLGGSLSAPIERIGRANGRLVVGTAGALYLADADITGVGPAGAEQVPGISWATPADAPPELERRLGSLYRGQGLTVERLLMDLHSGRVIARAGPLILDLVALGLVLLSVSGLVFWYRGGRAKNGNGGNGRR